MDKELKDKWCSALRSGNYKQGHGALKETDSKEIDHYCCLGVLGDIIPEMYFYGSRLRRMSDNVGCGDGYLNNNGLEFAGGLTKDDQEVLAEMNDGDDVTPRRIHTFDEIADHIESNL